MKQLAIVMTVLAVLVLPLAAAAQDAHVAHAATAKFVEFPNVPPCAKGAVYQGDPASGPATIFIRSAAGCRIPLHWHTANETLMVVSGTARVGMKGQTPDTLRPGSYAFVPSKHHHNFVCPVACNFFLVSDAAFDIHYVDDAGGEIPMDQALKAKAAPAAAPKKP
jgi:quercetin dioxygenase-like cupin family protein